MKSYLNGGKTRVPLAMTSLRPWRFLVMRWSAWYHSMVGGGSPRATHSSLAPELLENTEVRGGSIRQIGAWPLLRARIQASSIWIWLASSGYIQAFFGPFQKNSSSKILKDSKKKSSKFPKNSRIGQLWTDYHLTFGQFFRKNGRSTFFGLLLRLNITMWLQIAHLVLLLSLKSQP